jgi:hypothetical protein
MLEPGDIVRFNYLWAREAQRGEETGRKARPSCVVVKTERSLFLLPLTSQKPADSRAALAVPETECRRGKLQSPCWIIVDEYNRVLHEQFQDFESVEPQGRFSRAFLLRIAGSLQTEAKSRRVKAVERR